MFPSVLAHHFPVRRRRFMRLAATVGVLAVIGKNADPVRAATPTDVATDGTSPLIYAPPDGAPPERCISLMVAAARAGTCPRVADQRIVRCSRAPFSVLRAGATGAQRGGGRSLACVAAECRADLARRTARSRHWIGARGWIIGVLV